VGTHTGTHIDPPYHFLEEGRTVDEIPLDVLVGDCYVGDLTSVAGTIGPDELDALLAVLEVSSEALSGDVSANRFSAEIGARIAGEPAAAPSAARRPLITRLLLKTRNSTLWGSAGAKPEGRAEFPKEYVALSPEGAEWTVEQGISLVGIDFLSIEAAASSGSSAASRAAGSSGSSTASGQVPDANPAIKSENTRHHPVVE